MNKTTTTTVFKNYDEYLAHYNAKQINLSANKSRVYNKGEEIAIDASRKAMQEIEPKKNFLLTAL